MAIKLQVGNKLVTAELLVLQGIGNWWGWENMILELHVSEEASRASNNFSKYSKQII